MIDLGGGYSAERLSDHIYHESSALLESRIFGHTSVYRFDPAPRPDVPRGETYSWGIFQGGELIGDHHAFQWDERSVYMADSGLLPEHRGRGVYTRLLPYLLNTFREAGYTMVRSVHRATNNAVIIPKLRVGFFIQGLNLYEGVRASC
ncbi:GNAT family N-acetyltransferase [Deinococcus sp.]|uniref:GNAT family N-acetyltransferase n=1 Tax=Deinococcus sp. TaxID=47478 RepID=UPI003C7A9D11